MPFIKNIDDYRAHIDLLTMSPATSLFFQELCQINIPEDGAVTQGMINTYGIEWLIDGSGKDATGSFVAGIFKNLLIEDIMDFVGRNLGYLPATNIKGLIAALEMASFDAEYALTDEGRFTLPDPRCRTCFAVSIALANLATYYSALDPEISRLAIAALVKLGAANFEDFSTVDAGVIGYSYFHNLVDLISDPQTTASAASVLIEMQISGMDKRNYAGSVALCALMQKGQSQIFSIPSTKHNITRTTFLLLEGLKIVEPGSPEVDRLTDLLCAIVSDKVIQRVAPNIAANIEKRITAECDRVHHRLLGGHLAISGPLALMAMKRTQSLAKAHEAGAGRQKDMHPSFSHLLALES